LGTADGVHRVGLVSFAVEGVHPHDLGTILDHEGVAIRTGHHCTQPLMDRLGVTATARASLGCYSGRDDDDRLELGLEKAISLLR
jgi:cysteine desulfurase/selenocysteine lyase